MTRRRSIAGWTRRVIHGKERSRWIYLLFRYSVQRRSQGRWRIFVSAHYDLPGSIECKLLLRGWNDTFEIRTKDGERFIFRISKRRARGDADVASETAFLAYLDSEGIPVAAAVPVRDGSLFTSALFPGRSTSRRLVPLCGRTPVPSKKFGCRCESKRDDLGTDSRCRWRLRRGR